MDQDYNILTPLAKSVFNCIYGLISVTTNLGMKFST